MGGSGGSEAWEAWASGSCVGGGLGDVEAGGDIDHEVTERERVTKRERERQK